MVGDFRNKIVKGGHKNLSWVRVRKLRIADAKAETQYPVGEKASSHLSGNLPTMLDVKKLFPVRPKNPGIHEPYGFPGAKQAYKLAANTCHSFTTSANT